MKKSWLTLLLAGLAAFSACNKEEDTEPVPAVVGNWAVQPVWIDPATNMGRPGVFLLNFELELFAGETGWRRDISGEQALEWDLFNGDKSIVLTSRQSFLNDTVFVAQVCDIRFQNETSGEWVLPWKNVVTDSITGTTVTYEQHWFLSRL